MMTVPMPHAELVTRRWLQEVVIGLNLCPFARREFDANRIRFAVTPETEPEALLLAFATELSRLARHPEIETTLLIYANAVPDFHDYLDMLDMAQAWLEDQELEGVFQLASFHPAYQFDGSGINDEANYTNRSPLPVIHILREDSVEKAVASHPDPDMIPERNIALAREKGLKFWQETLRGLIAEVR